jgi:hypothetical protein
MATTRAALTHAAPTDQELDAAREYRALRDRETNPVGAFDQAGRWYPTHACECAVRAPSRAWPYSYLVHCRTADHVAKVRGVTRANVLRALKTLEA